METVCCIDTSGSTNITDHGSYYGWVKNFISSLENTDFIDWSTKAHVTTKAKMLLKNEGNFGTDPSSFIPMVKNYKKLIIITDGQIDDREVVTCSKLLENRKDFSFNEIEIHCFYTGGEINLSISTPFSSNVKFYIQQHKGGVTDTVAEGHTTLDLDQYFENPSLLIESANTLVSSIKFGQVGKSTPNTELKDKLCELQSKLKHQDMKKTVVDFNQIRELLQDQKYDEAVKTISPIFEIDLSKIKEICSVLDRMMSACDVCVGYSFDLLKNGQLRRAAELDDVDIDSLEVEEDIDYECSISYDTDTPTLLVKSGAGVLTTLDKKLLDQIIENPFTILEHPEVVSLIKGRIGSVIGLKTTQNLNSSIDPYNRAQFSSCLITSNSDEVYKVNKRAVADILFGNKLVGNYSSFVAVLYIIFKDWNYFTEDSDRNTFVINFRNTMLSIFKKTNTSITLSPFVIEPMISAPYDVALWYCVVSPFISKYQGKSNRVRNLGVTTKYLMNLLDILQYPYDRIKTERMNNLYMAFDYMQSSDKSLVNIIRSQWQNHCIVDDEIVMLDGPATFPIPLPQCLQTITLSEVVKLLSLVDHQKSTYSIPIYTDFVGSPIPTYVNNYGYDYSDMENIVKSLNTSVTISKETFRPLTRVRTSNGGCYLGC